ncbi:MAG: AraC family transcriptional regulator [Pseudomonadales bacterium]
MSAEISSTKYAHALLSVARERGYSVEEMLLEAGIEFNPLDGSAPEGFEISAVHYSRLYEQLLSFLQDESFAAIGTGVTAGTFRMMCYAILHCDNLGRAMQRAGEFFRIFLVSEAQLPLTVENEDAYIGYALENITPDITITDLEVHGLVTWHRFCCWLTGRTVELKSVSFQWGVPAASERERYEKLFGCAIRYGQPRNVLVFDAACLSWSLVHTEQSLKTFLRTAPFTLMTMPARAEDNSLVEQVRSLLGHDFSQGLPGFEEVTEKLHMSAPTLRRRLKREGKTFQQLKDECRRDAAVAYLRRPDLSINAVAILMGFTDPSAFHRSFKKWTGIPPGEYRQRSLNGVPEE